MKAQLNFFKIHWRHRYCHGGSLRRSRQGRGARPLSTREPIHLVFKSNHKTLRTPVTYTLILKLVRQYASRFFVKIEQISVQGDHIHCLIRCSKRSMLQNFFRVLAGQISQRVTGTFGQSQSGQSQTEKSQTRQGHNGLKFWRHRPFTRVIKGWKAYKTVQNYIQLNEQEACGKRPYRKERLRGLSPDELQSLWE